ncbi:MAG TPA: hypothetical protein VFQ53_12150 [Kofleriaceae bacterium]|nr:hypothetical protein [Kofleriaceae bacterium]
MVTARLPSTSSEPTVRIDGALERFVATSFRQLDRRVRVTLATLVEPRVSDPARALQRLQRLVETLTGLAIGGTLGALATAIRRGFDATTTAAVDRELAAIAHHLAPACLPLAGSTMPFLADADRRPLVDELGQRLHRRLGHASRETTELATRLVAAIDTVPLVRCLDRLADDPLPADRFADHLTRGWAALSALVAGTPWHDDGRPWQAWMRRARGEREAQTTTQAALVAAGYINRIG